MNLSTIHDELIDKMHLRIANCVFSYFCYFKREVGRDLFPYLPSEVAQELAWFLKLVAAPAQERLGLYQQWERETASVPKIDEECLIPLSEILLQIYRQGTACELLAKLQQLVSQGIPPNPRRRKLGFLSYQRPPEISIGLT